MNALTNVLGYQGVWLLAVLGAARGSAWPALAGLAAFAIWQLAISRTRAADLKLIGLALLLGMLLDGALAAGGLLGYATPAPALPAGGAPLWILALWAAFALTLNHSLAWLRHRVLWAALLGSTGGPLAYAAAERLAGAVHWSRFPVATTALLAAGWGAALLLLTWSAGRWARDQDAARGVRT